MIRLDSLNNVRCYLKFSLRLKRKQILRVKWFECWREDIKQFQVKARKVSVTKPFVVILLRATHT